MLHIFSTTLQAFENGFGIKWTFKPAACELVTAVLRQTSSVQLPAVRHQPRCGLTRRPGLYI